MSKAPDSLQLQRARGHFALKVRCDDGRSVLSHLEQGGCSRLLFPRLYQGRNTPLLEAVSVNISGGMAAGDKLEGRITLAEKAALLLTSQAHERLYKARPEDEPASMMFQCVLEEGAHLEWLPHGTIFFDGAHFERHMDVEMAENSTFLYYESRIFGRYGSDEVIRKLSLKDHLTIKRGGALILRDSMILEDQNCEAFFARSAITGGKYVTATLVLVDPQAEGKLAALRELEAQNLDGLLASSAWNGMVVLRILAERSWALEQLMMRVLPIIRGDRLMPSSWRP